MCYNGKCMHFIKMETGSLIFGIFSAIFTGLSSLLAIGTFIYVSMVIDTPDVRKAIDKYFSSVYNATIFFIIILCITLSSFAFSVVLIKGIVKKNPAHVKAYYNYGVFIICSTLAVMSFGIQLPIQLLIVIGAIYYLILRMIRMTYKKLRSNKVIRDGNTKFVEKKFPSP